MVHRETVTFTNQASAVSKNADTNQSDSLDIAVSTLQEFDEDGLKNFVDPNDDNGGASDAEEMIADIDIADPASILKMTAIIAGAESIGVTWQRGALAT